MKHPRAHADVELPLLGVIDLPEVIRVTGDRMERDLSKYGLSIAEPMHLELVPGPWGNPGTQLARLSWKVVPSDE